MLFIDLREQWYIVYSVQCSLLHCDNVFITIYVCSVLPSDCAFAVFHINLPFSNYWHQLSFFHWINYSQHRVSVVLTDAPTATTGNVTNNTSQESTFTRTFAQYTSKYSSSGIYGSELNLNKLNFVVIMISSRNLQMNSRPICLPPCNI